MPKPISIKLIFISLLIGFFFYSCSSSKSTTTNSKAGVVITIDDYFAKEWKEADVQLAKYNWKATFYVSNYEKRSVSDISNLKELQTK